MKQHGSSYRITAKVFNAVQQAPSNLPPIGVTAVYNAIKNSKHIIASRVTKPQTDENNTFHQQEKYNWFAQILARLGEIIPPNPNSEFRSRLRDDFIEYDKLKEDNLTFVLEQVAFWDEIHIKQVVGSDVKKVFLFPTNHHGLYDEDEDIDKEGTENVSKMLRCNHEYCII